jgi:hypothetical protein
VDDAFAATAKVFVDILKCPDSLKWAASTTPTVTKVTVQRRGTHCDFSAIHLFRTQKCFDGNLDLFPGPLISLVGEDIHVQEHPRRRAQAGHCRTVGFQTIAVMPRERDGAIDPKETSRKS